MNPREMSTGKNDRWETLKEEVTEQFIRLGNQETTMTGSGMRLAFARVLNRMKQLEGKNDV